MSDAPDFVRPDVKDFLEALKLQREERGPVTIESMRAAMQATGKYGDPEPRPLATIEDLRVPGADGEIGARLYDPRETRAPGPLVVFIHGGGFVAGDIDTHHSFCTEAASELDLPVLSLDYRLAPEAPFPAAPDDCEAATRWVAAQKSLLGREFTGLVLMGDSAGGNLAVITTMALMETPADLPVILEVLIYPTAGPVKDTPSYQSFKNGYLLEQESMNLFNAAYNGSLEDPKFNPLLRNLSLAPPTLLATAGLDPLRDSGRKLASALIAAGVDVTYLEPKGIMHGFINCRLVVPSALADTRRLLAMTRLMIDQQVS